LRSNVEQTRQHVDKPFTFTEIPMPNVSAL